MCLKAGLRVTESVCCCIHIQVMGKAGDADSCCKEARAILRRVEHIAAGQITVQTSVADRVSKYKEILGALESSIAASD